MNVDLERVLKVLGDLMSHDLYYLWPAYLLFAVCGLIPLIFGISRALLVYTNPNIDGPPVIFNVGFYKSLHLGNPDIGVVVGATYSALALAFGLILSFANLISGFVAPWETLGVLLAVIILVKVLNALRSHNLNHKGEYK